VILDDDLELLAESGLRYASDAEPGIRRRRAGRGSTYVRDGGERVTDERTLGRIRALAIPPAWTDVWICRTANGHLQATGRDARGRKQYRYHDEWRRLRDEAKYSELVTFGNALGRLRGRVEDDLARSGMPQEKVVALVIALLDRTLIRIGNEAYRRENGTYGLTTLMRKHVAVDGATVRFQFTAKGGLVQRVRLSDRRLAAAVRRCHELGGREVFSYVGDDGEVHRVDSADCNDYLRDVVGGTTTVKTFRTWGGSATALEHLANHDGDPTQKAVLEAIDSAASRLGNTRAVARRAYVHPAVPEAFLDGRLDDAWASARRTETMTRPERALLRLLASELEVVEAQAA
jgi:DNA topoisomerase-1